MSFELIKKRLSTRGSEWLASLLALQYSPRRAPRMDGVSFFARARRTKHPERGRLGGASLQRAG
jgi:hypothetical protein